MGQIGQKERRKNLAPARELINFAEFSRLKSESFLSRDFFCEGSQYSHKNLPRQQKLKNIAKVF